MIESSVIDSRASGCGAVDVEIVNQSDNCFGADMLQRKCATKSYKSRLLSFSSQCQTDWESGFSTLGLWVDLPESWFWLFSKSSPFFNPARHPRPKGLGIGSPDWKTARFWKITRTYYFHSTKTFPFWSDGNWYKSKYRGFRTRQQSTPILRQRFSPWKYGRFHCSIIGLDGFVLLSLNRFPK